ncbi:MAG TPA: hypothetical protein VER37_08095 [Thermomicrobiales bacterium]|nr:hypothetical protein [Thermomicrobiales bacterium]
MLDKAAPLDLRDLLALLAALALVVFGADLLLDGLLAVARRWRRSAFALVVLLAGMEPENLATGIAANLDGLPGAALGTCLGGSVFIALGVSGLGGLIAPARVTPKWATVAWTAAAPVPLALLALDGRVGRLDGALLLLWFAVAIAGLTRTGGVPPAADDDDKDEERTRFHPLLVAAGGLALLSAGGSLLGDALRSAAAGIGAGPTLLGNTAVAAAVEAEEVARVVVPARRGRPDLALANIAGTVVHFVALNAGLIALVRPLPLDAATRTVHLPAAVVAPALCLILIRARGRLDRPAGLALLLLYALYVGVAVRFPGGLGQ